jgi:threonine dehydratase/serine racemase
MPSSAAAVKRRAVAEYGGRIVECEPTLAARESTAERVLAETGGVFVHPYDQVSTIAGQGTAALELLADVPDLDAIITPVGGGGLLAGTCIAAKGVRPEVRVFGAEPKGADDAAQSLVARQLMPQRTPRTIADGLLTSLGKLTWPVIRDHVEGILTVADPDILLAMRHAWERAKLLIEPSAAVAIAVALSAEFRALPGLERVGVILSGGNVDLDALGRDWRFPSTL